MKCYACFNNSANSLEHILPKFLGGRKKVRILCHLCNNKFGSTFEQSFYNCENSKKLTFLKIALNFYFFKAMARQNVLTYITDLNDGNCNFVNLQYVNEDTPFNVEFYINGYFAEVSCGKIKALIK